jgi:uroporphyrinogen III methyltransferase/synthase
MSIGEVWYVGAGPGDPELISVRGERLLHQAQVVIHDSGVAPELLEQCDATAQLIEARVSPTPATEELAAIAQQVIAAARAGSRVLRLKVGDPLLFSRALEEIAVVSDAGLKVQIIPGICTPLGASAFAGIPLTPPGGSGNVTFLSTLHLRAESVSELLSTTAHACNSVCVFCTSAQLTNTVETLQKMPGLTGLGAALVSRATQPEQAVIEAPLSELLHVASQRAVDEPFLLFVGSGVTWRQQLAWFERLPLQGRRLLLCRAKHQARESARMIRERGARPVLLPLLAIEPPSDPTPFDRCVTRLSDYDWIVLTSANGTEQLLQAIKAKGLDARALGKARLAVIGPGTAKPLAKWGLVPDLIAQEHVAEGLAADLLRAGKAQSVLLARAEQARDVLPEALRHAGLRVDVVAAYRTRKLDGEQSSKLRQLFERNEIDAVLLTSSSMADALVSALSPNASELLTRTVVASIGPITTATLEKLGVRVDVSASEYTVDGLLVALGQHFANQNRRKTDATPC